MQSNVARNKGGTARDALSSLSCGARAFKLSRGHPCVRQTEDGMTELLYEMDSYLSKFDATIIAVDEENHGVVLDRTAFFPGLRFPRRSQS